MDTKRSKHHHIKSGAIYVSRTKSCNKEGQKDVGKERTTAKLGEQWEQKKRSPGFFCRSPVRRRSAHLVMFCELLPQVRHLLSNSLSLAHLRTPTRMLNKNKPDHVVSDLHALGETLANTLVWPHDEHLLQNALRGGAD